MFLSNDTINTPTDLILLNDDHKDKKYNQRMR